jgi:ferredoxin
MAYTIAEPCIDVKDTACVDVCPVDCIHPTKNEAEAFQQLHQLYIDPEECIDCGACEPVCPVEAIFENDALPEKWKHYAQINADYLQKERIELSLSRACGGRRAIEKRKECEAINTATNTMEDLVNREYKYGFVTEIEAEPCLTN